MLKNIPKFTITTICVIIASLLTGCASSQGIVRMGDVTLENIDSSSVRISRSYLSTTKEIIVLRGELARRIPARGPIPGHLHIELVGPDNKVIKKSEIGYRRKNIRSRYARFSLEIPTNLTAGSIIRIIHHDVRSHSIESPGSSWQDTETIE